MKPIDIVKLRAEIKAGYLSTFIKRGKIYLIDNDNGECVMIGDVEEATERGAYE